MDNQGVSKVLNATAAHVAALTSGTEASTQVAITCLGGHSFGQLLVHTSTFDVESRYLGMKKAFGDDMEILATTGSSPPQDLRAADYDKLVSNAEAAHASSRAASSYVPTPMPSIQAPAPAAGSGTAAVSASNPASSPTSSNGVPATNTARAGSPPHQHPPPTPTAPQASEASPIDEPNPYLSVYANFPIIKWGRSVHHPSLTIIYTIIGVFSTFGLLIFKWFKGGSWLFEIVYLTSFLAVNFYTMIMLDVRREVCYVEVSRDDVSAGMCATWETLKAEAKSMPRTKEEALQNLRRGLVCHLAGSETILVPVMGIMTRIEDAPASWWILFNELRAPIVQIGLYLLPDDHIDWVVIYGVAAYFQARMLRACSPGGLWIHSEKEEKAGGGKSYSHLWASACDTSTLYMAWDVLDAPQADKPYLLFIHGFPSTSYDWRYQVTYFSGLGYGLIVPDMLGYGGTSKPTEVEAYTNSRSSKDLIDILDAEGVTKCIAIGHDWGSRLADLYEDRFIAFAFFAVGYIAPCPTFDMDEVFALTKKLAGHETLGYWGLLTAPDGSEIIEKNFESFFSITYSGDLNIVSTHFTPSGALRAWVESGQTTDIAAWLSEEEQKVHKEVLIKGGLTGPVNWYKVWTSGFTAEEDKGVPIRSPAISKPVFFGATTNDIICVPKPQIKLMKKACADLTVHEFEAGHWVMVEKKDEFNKVLGSWLEGLIAKQ
ncbi:hypothetical protein EYR40_003363 [Pleurotus pulmonarius]|nr:hypothetical protein EYR40_003363 [Pleurotus pulmonarius]